MGSIKKIQSQFITSNKTEVTESGVEPISGLHDKRRERMRARFLEQGTLSGFQPHEVLEMMLYGSIPRKDTNVIAHRLINRFGSISSVLNADISDLKEVEGMSEISAISLHMHRGIGEYTASIDAVSRRQILTLKDAYAYVFSHIGGFSTEHLLALCLDSSQRVLNKETIERGSPSTVAYFTRTVIKKCLNSPTTSVIFAHNHPSGLNLPSYEDAMMTESLTVALAHAGIELADHIIVTSNKGKSYSFRKAGHLHGYLVKYGLKPSGTLKEGSCFLYSNEIVQRHAVITEKVDIGKRLMAGNQNVSKLIAKARAEWEKRK